MQRLPLSVLVVLTPLVALTVGCTDRSPAVTSSPKADEDLVKPLTLPVGTREVGGDWGDVKGQVVWAGGDLPQPRKLDVNKDQAHCQSKGDIYSEEWVVNKDNKGVRWAVVWLAPEGDGKLLVHPSLEKVKPDTKHVMDQPCCKFEPHVLSMRAGEVLVAKNGSPIAHSFKYGGIGVRGDSVMIPESHQKEVKDLKPSKFPIVVECAIHPWMRAHVWVFDHPYHAVTDENGKFEIKNAPAGKHRIFVWQEAIGYRTGDSAGEPIEIKAGTMNEVGKWEVKPR